MKILLLTLLCVSVAHCGTIGSFNSLNSFNNIDKPFYPAQSLFSQAISSFINQILLPVVRQLVENVKSLIPPAAQKSIANLLEDFKPLIKKLQQKENVPSINGVNNFSHEKTKNNDNTMTINGKAVNLKDYGASNEKGWSFSGVKIINNKVVDPGTLNGVPMRWNDGNKLPQGAVNNKKWQNTGVGNVGDADGNPRRAARRAQSLGQNKPIPYIDLTQDDE
uniref:Uncharacterized protein n=1 Tax=Cacopsylla melanoneura TaxID=428564 RepID=A0A8D8UC31_9HEMI